jgi:hypothetical protein
MTEAEWLACTELGPLLEYLREKASDRKLRLFACACFRRIWHLLLDERSRKAVEVVERFAEGLATEEELAAARSAANAAADEAGDIVSEADAVYGEDPSTADAYSAAEAARSAADAPCFVVEHDISTANAASSAACAIGCDAEAAAYTAADPAAEVAEQTARAAETLAQANLLRDLVGNPFQPQRLEPTWLSWNAGTIPKMVQAIYDDRSFDRLPILADALEDAGCDNADILAHCRRPGEHVRGCWVVDLLLGKE